MRRFDGCEAPYAPLWGCEARARPLGRPEVLRRQRRLHELAFTSRRLFTSRRVPSIAAGSKPLCACTREASAAGCGNAAVLRATSPGKSRFAGVFCSTLRSTSHVAPNACRSSKRNRVALRVAPGGVDGFH